MLPLRYLSLRLLCSLYDSLQYFRVNYYENSAKVPHASLNPRMAAIIQQNFPNHSECLNYHTRDLSLLGRDIFASNAEKEDKVIIQGQAPDPFVFADGALIPVL